VSGEGYFKALYNRAPFGYVTTDQDDLIVHANETFLALGEFGADALQGLRFRDLLQAGSQLLYETKHLPVLRMRGSANDIFLQLVKADGTLLPVLVNAAGDYAADGESVGVRIGVLDASNRVSYERELLAAQRTAEQLAARVTVLQNASVEFARGSTEAQIAETLATILEDSLSAGATCVALVDREGELRVEAGINPLEGLIRGDAGLLGSTVVELESPIVVGVGDDDIERFPWVVEALRDARLQTVAVFPVMNDSTPIGVIAAFFKRARQLTPSEVELVLAVARQASQALTRRRAQDQLAFAALHDQLTGLANRALIRENLTRELTEAAGKPLTLMFLDLDGFKPVNDRLGHHTGDAILREVAKRLTDSVRSNDIVGRYGGDEFVVICRGTGTDDAAAVADRIRTAIRGGFSEAAGFTITASIGIAVHNASSPVSTDELIDAADAAMYESKRLGRDRTTRVSV